MPDYLVMQHCEDERAWSIDGLGPIKRNFRLVEGVRLVPDYPPRVVFPLDPSSGNMKVDFIRNLDRVILASPRAREVLLANGVSEKDVELLPAFLRDKKGRELDEPYTIFNPVASAPMDRKRSRFDCYAGSDDVMGVERLFIAADQIPGHLVLFRVRDYPSHILIRDDLLKAIEAAGLTGFRAVPQGEPLI